MELNVSMSDAQKGGQVCTSVLRKTPRLLHKWHEKKTSQKSLVQLR